MIFNFFDYFGWLPKWLTDLSPFHGSMIITSMGSLGIGPIYHHLYDFGNVPLFVAIGNYLPKCKQNYTMGIKLPWTLADENNWNRTHRFAGPIWVVCGLVIMLCGLIGGAFLWVMVAAFVVMIAAPTVYSYLLFKGKIK